MIDEALSGEVKTCLNVNLKPDNDGMMLDLFLVSIGSELAQKEKRIEPQKGLLTKKMLVINMVEINVVIASLLCGRRIHDVECPDDGFGVTKNWFLSFSDKGIVNFSRINSVKQSLKWLKFNIENELLTIDCDVHATQEEYDNVSIKVNLSEFYENIMNVRFW